MAKSEDIANYMRFLSNILFFITAVTVTIAKMSTPSSPDCRKANISALFRGTVNIWLHYTHFRADSDIRLLSFIIQSTLQSRTPFVTRLANKPHCINHPNLNFNAFHIPADMKHSRYNVLESQNTNKPREPIEERKPV